MTFDLGPWIFQPLDITEIVVGLLVVLVVLRASAPALRCARHVRVAFFRAARWPAIVPVLAIAPVGLRVLFATLPGFHFPRPSTHDEFSYLLAGDTFAHFRLANPQHPMWRFFDTFHILSHPTYASKYPPAQGMALAAGKLLFGNFRAGVHLSIASLVIATYWMLRAWVPRRWALLGAMIVIVRFGLFSYWMDSFWGGAVAAIGGALVLGAFPRIMRSPNSRDAVIAALGAFILATSRPFEGALYCVPFAVALTFWLIRSAERTRWTKFALPFALVFGFGLAWMGYYNYRVTGSALTLPHALYAKQNQVQPYFRWQKPSPQPEYTRPELRRFWLEFDPGFGRTKPSDRFANFVFFYFPMLQLGILLASLPWLWRTQTVVLWSALALPLCASLFASYDFLAHYVAPVTGITILFVVLGLRRLETLRWNDRPSGRIFAWSVPVVLVFMVLARLVAYPAHILILPAPASWNHSTLDNGIAIPIEQKLRKEPANLVFVRYSPDHNFHNEWVFNQADIDHAHTVWACDKGPLNEELIRYYPGREVWLLEPDQDPIRLSKYPGLEPSRK